MITVSGILKTPAGTVLANTEIKFYAVATASTVLQGTTGLITTGSDGSYSVTLQQGSHRVTVRQGNTRPETIGMVHISADTTAATLNELLLAAIAASPGNPLSDEILAARDRAEVAATEAEASRVAAQQIKDDAATIRDQTSQISGLSTVAEAIDYALPDAMAKADPARHPFRSKLPTLASQFDRNQHHVQGQYGLSAVDLLTAFTVERSTIGSYRDALGVIRYAGINEHRIDHNPETGECLGVLMENSAVNLERYSETDGVAWPIKNNATYWLGTPIVKSGVTLDKYTYNNPGFNDFPSSSPKASFSVFFYDDGVTTGTAIVLRGEVRGDSVLTGTVIFNYDSKEFSATLNAGFTYRVIKHPGRLYRVCLDADTAVTNVSNLRLALYSDKNWLGGVQVEESAQVSSYIKTSGAQGVRGIDSHLYAQPINFSDYTSGTVFIDVIPSTSLSNFWWFSVNGWILLRTSGAGLSSMGGDFFWPGNFMNIRKAAVSYHHDTGRCIVAVDGVVVYDQLTGAGKKPAVTAINLHLMRWFGGSQFGRGHCRSAVLYPTAFTDTELAELTA